MRYTFDKTRVEMGERIRILRKEKVGKQELFAELLDVSPITISRIENGLTKVDAPLLIKMSEILKVSADEILGLEKS